MSSGSGELLRILIGIGGLLGADDVKTVVITLSILNTCESWTAKVFYSDSGADRASQPGQQVAIAHLLFLSLQSRLLDIER